MDGEQHSPAQPLPDIVGSRLPWFRARLSTILVWPTTHGGWVAILHYAQYTTVQPGETPPPDMNPTYPHDTQHALALDGEEVAAVLGAQVRALESAGELGGLKVNRVVAPPWTPGGPPSPGWTIFTHSGSEAERRAWQRRIGQAL